MKRTKSGKNLAKSFLVFTIIALSAKIFTIFGVRTIISDRWK